MVFNKKLTSFNAAAGAQRHVTVRARHVRTYSQEKNTFVSLNKTRPGRVSVRGLVCVQSSCDLYTIRHTQSSANHLISSLSTLEKEKDEWNRSDNREKRKRLKWRKARDGDRSQREVTDSGGYWSGSSVG